MNFVSVTDRDTGKAQRESMKNLEMTRSTLASKKAEVKARHAELNSWAKVAAEYPPVKRGTLQRFATSKYNPKDRAIRSALGLVKASKPRRTRKVRNLLNRVLGMVSFRVKLTKKTRGKCLTHAHDGSKI